MKITT